MACRDAVARTLVSKTDFVFNLPCALPQALFLREHSRRTCFGDIGALI